MRKTISLFAIIVLFCSNVFAGDQFLKACLEVGENRDKKLLAAKEQVNAASLRITRSGRAFLPGISLQRKTARGKALRTLENGEVQSDEYQSEELGVRALQPLYDGGRLRASYRYDKLLRENAKLNLTKTRQDLYYRIKTAYYEFLAARSELKRLKDTFDDIQRLQQKSQLEFNVKAISDLDLQEGRNFRDKVENMYRSAKMNAELSEKKLLFTVDIKALDEIAAPFDIGSLAPPEDISYTHEEARRFVTTNNMDARTNLNMIEMNEQKKKITSAKTLPKLYAEGYYGQSGEVFVTQPLSLTTAWSISGRVSWGLWGNSLEVSSAKDYANPQEIIDLSRRIDNTTNEIKLSLFDDLGYFVEQKESAIGIMTSKIEYRDSLNRAIYEFDKFYNEYQQSLWNARTTKDEIRLRERKLEVMRKRNELYEISTLEVMDGVYKYAETVMSYMRSLATNYLAVCEMERLTMLQLR
ncbi:MAG: hypothetical protein A2219_00815 [Elusimicrobia bacterium RIFOXYA2_FULL_50_26]|nr:MAG: hypothetical protein A2219_00815 [Elusimicrobia bacterium RIFOXYA2_FULL_50_26]OGS23200.1 MAG: hypothetical protein A2314_06285 [Elusimicrobia bacterium RIFOXYB2_FULL_50_12]